MGKRTSIPVRVDERTLSVLRSHDAFSARINQVVDRYLQLLAPHMESVMVKIEPHEWEAVRRAVGDSLALRDLAEVKSAVIDKLWDKDLAAAIVVQTLSKLEFAALVEVVEASREYMAPTTQPAT